LAPAWVKEILEAEWTSRFATAPQEEPIRERKKNVRATITGACDTR
jgi:hypothetical protein